mgnify:CR=1 FL=1
MKRLKTALIALVPALVALSASIATDGRDLIGPLPPQPDYADSTQWFVRYRGASADLYYIISTETAEYLLDGDTCRFADTRNEALRKRMRHEMTAVDSFYSGPLNYFSPYYRQVTMQSWASERLAMARIPVALGDTRRSWDYYLAHLNHGRPFVLAGFSQGAHAMLDILRDMPDSVASRMVAAYVIGYKVTQHDLDSFPHIRPAQGATDTGVTICFNSVRSPSCEIPITSGGNVLCINPVNWRTDTVSAPFVFRDRHHNDTMSAHCDPESHLLIVDGCTDNYVMPVIGVPGNYHHRELKFYYPYIRQNIAERLEAYLRSRQEQQQDGE